MRWRRTEEEWELVVEDLEDRLEAERERRLKAEHKTDELAAELQALREATGWEAAGVPVAAKGKTSNHMGG